MEAFAALLQERLTFLCAGLILGALWVPSLWPHGLARQLEQLILSLELKLNRSHRTVAARVWRGLILVLFLMSVAAFVGYGVSYIAVQAVGLELVVVVLIALLIPSQCLRKRAANIGRAVKRQQLDYARGLAGGLARRDVAELDEAGLRRVALEYVAENFNDQFIAPALWFLLLGLPGLCALRMLNLLDHLLGHKSKQRLAFGWAAAKLDDVAMLVPARMAGILLACAACFIPRGKPLGAFGTLWRQSGATSSPNAGWPLSAMAGALCVALGGPRRQQGALIDDAWIGRGSARISQTDFRRGLALYNVAALLWLLCCLVTLALCSDISLIPQSLLGE